MRWTCSSRSARKARPASTNSGTRANSSTHSWRGCARTQDEDLILGQALVGVTLNQCSVWPKGPVSVDFTEPLTLDVPVLLLSGEFDPVTPPRYGDEVAKSLPNGRHLVLRGQGHNVIGAGCMPKLFAQFLQTTDADALDASCLDDLAYVPPFTSFNGWEP